MACGSIAVALAIGVPALRGWPALVSGDNREPATAVASNEPAPTEVDGLAQDQLPAGGIVAQTARLESTPTAGRQAEQRGSTSRRSAAQRAAARRRAQQVASPADGRDATALVEATPAPLAATPVAAPAVTPLAADLADRVARPAGPAFEVTQVDSRPRVEASVTPRVADLGREGPLNDVVILRVLVSPAGRTSDVQVLRRSKVDSTIDAAAISAVRQWRFSPARKRGEAVSCWFSVGVPVTVAGTPGSP